MSERLYEAVVFDMDGVLADSEPVYFISVNAVLASYGREISEEQHSTVMALGPEEVIARILGMAGLILPVSEFMEAYSRDLLERLPKLSRPLPGVVETIEALKRRGTPLALASSSKPDWIEAVLGGIGLTAAFDAVVSGSMVAHPKPAPDIYLLAAERIGIAPEACIAIEDTPTGLASAKAAGMLTVQVRSSSTAFPPQPAADLVLPSLEEFDHGLVRNHK